MKALRNWLDKQKPHFQPGGKLEKFRSTFGAIETFMFVPNHTTKKGAHIRDYVDLKRTMTMVIIALIPCVLLGMYNVGYQHSIATGDSMSFIEMFFFGFIKVFPIIVVSYLVAFGIEFAAAQMRGHEVNEGALVTGLLVPLIMPVNTPLWMIAVAMAFAIIFGKEVFGGTGMNILNPALTARAFLFFAYPTQMSGESVWVSLDGMKAVDGFSGATPMGQALAGHHITASVSDMFIGLIPGSIGETSTIACIIGAIILIWTGVGSWKIMLSTVLGCAFVGILLNVFAGDNSYMQVPFWHHFIMGGFAFGTVFMATDPVSASQTDTGKWIYGFLIGALALVFRVLNPAYPEGMMLAILLMNVFAPLIDYYIVEANIKRRLKRASVNA